MNPFPTNLKLKVPLIFTQKETRTHVAWQVRGPLGSSQICSHDIQQNIYCWAVVVKQTCREIPPTSGCDHATMRPCDHTTLSGAPTM